MDTLTGFEESQKQFVSELKVADRCDRCIAQAFLVVVKLVDDIELKLLFCKHHYEAHEAALLGQGFVTVVDDRNRINEKPQVRDDDDETF